MNDCYYDIAEAELLKPFGLTLERLKDRLNAFVHSKIDFADFYLQKSVSESWTLDDGVVKYGEFAIEQGIAVRAVYNGKTGFAYADDLRLETIDKLIVHVLSSMGSRGHKIQIKASRKNDITERYGLTSPLDTLVTKDKITLLRNIDQYARSKDRMIYNVNATLIGQHEIIFILSTDGICAVDIRPLVRLNVMLSGQKGKRRETFSAGGGGRLDYDCFIADNSWKNHVDEAFDGLAHKLAAQSFGGGKMPVVLGCGWPAVLLHEAVGHGLEGDFNRKEISNFSHKIGQKVASEKCTVIDDGTLPGRRGSLNVDDEGTATKRNILIEKGILKGYMHDKISAKAFGVSPTGNGRRESYEYIPIPRMTNTFMLPGSDRIDEMIASIDHGIYATHFNGGQVDITSGQFVFVMDKAWLIKNGKIAYPIKGASLIGDGPDVMQKISMVGDDFALDAGIGTCGKDGQSVPVGVGQPSLKIDAITVGGV